MICMCVSLSCSGSLHNTPVKSYLTLVMQSMQSICYSLIQNRLLRCLKTSVCVVSVKLSFTTPLPKQKRKVCAYVCVSAVRCVLMDI